MQARQWGWLVVAAVLLAPVGVGMAPLEDVKLPGLAAPATAPEESGLSPIVPGPEVPGVHSSRYMDRDRNRVFDTLDTKLAAAPEGATFDVHVMLVEEPTEAKMGELKAATGGFVVTSYKDNPWDAEGKPWSVIPAFAATLSREQIVQLALRGDVQHIEAVHEVSVTMGTAKDESGVDKAKTDFSVNGDRTGAVKTFTKDDIVICVIDTGVYSGHVDLNEGQVIAFKDYVNGNTGAYDDHGHGTHVAGTAAGQGDQNSAYRGVAHGAAVVGVKVLNAQGSGSTTNIVNGINWCKDNKSTHGIEIISMSLGGGTCTDGTDTSSSAANGAWNAGLVVVVAAGNSGPGYCTIGDPGAASNVITVGAMSDPDNAACTGYKAKGWYIAPFSSRGLTADGRYKPDIMAPGVCITSVGTSSSTAYTTMSGTSMATPFVAGIVALMLDADPNLTPATVKSKVYSAGVDWGPDNQASEPQSYDYGAGWLDAHTAVESVCGCGTASPPANPSHYYAAEDLASTGKKDDFTLQVTGTTKCICLSLIIPSASGTKDFDLRLYDPNGSQKATSLGTTRQELISYTPGSTGAWKVRVESYSGSGSYWLDASATASSLTLSVDQ